ncbi:MAG: hypothetical protein KME30_26935 [Iphinoe sp. HA4291-MV1]|jgi:hypothetical protein|nr:hypothetical protein [Iphinoe sp. HA4291-MV1]
MAKQVRAVIDASLVPLADQILAETGINSHSQLIGLLIKNYGKQLAKAIKGENQNA